MHTRAQGFRHSQRLLLFWQARDRTHLTHVETITNVLKVREEERKKHTCVLSVALLSGGARISALRFVALFLYGPCARAPVAVSVLGLRER